MTDEPELYRAANPIEEMCDLNADMAAFIGQMYESEKDILLLSANKLVELHIQRLHGTNLVGIAEAFAAVEEDVIDLFPEVSEQSAFLAKTYRLTVAYLIMQFNEKLSTFAMLGLINSNMSPEEFRDKVAAMSDDERMWIHDVLDELRLLRNVLKAFEYRNGFAFPFSEIDAESSQWKGISEEVENFSHALNSSVNIDALIAELSMVFDIEGINDLISKPKQIADQMDGIPAFINLFDGFQRKLLQASEIITINNLNKIFRENIHLLNARVSGQTGSEMVVPLPIGFRARGRVEIRNADPYELQRAFLEIMNGAFADGKIETDQLESICGSKDKYMEISIKVITDEKNREFVQIKILDHGTPLPEFVMGQAASHGTDPINLISDRGVTFARNGEGQEYRHQGIGLHTARAIINEHNGDISVSNLPAKEGVEFKIVIPIEGKQSSYKYSLYPADEENPTSVQDEVSQDLGEFYEQIIVE